MTDTTTGGRVRRVLGAAFSKWNVLGTLTLLSGILIGLGVPVWEELWLKTPEVTVELNGIKRDFPDNASVTLGSDPDLSIINDVVQSYNRASYLVQPTIRNRRFASPYSFGPDELNDLILLVKQRIDRENNVLSHMKQTSEELHSVKFDNLTFSSISKYNEPLDSEVKIVPAEFDDHKSKTDATYFQSIKAQFVEKYKEEIRERQERIDDLNKRLPTAEKKCRIY